MILCSCFLNCPLHVILCPKMKIMTIRFPLLAFSLKVPSGKTLVHLCISVFLTPEGTSQIFTKLMASIYVDNMEWNYLLWFSYAPITFKTPIGKEQNLWLLQSLYVRIRYQSSWLAKVFSFLFHFICLVQNHNLWSLRYQWSLHPTIILSENCPHLTICPVIEIFCTLLLIFLCIFYFLTSNIKTLWTKILLYIYLYLQSNPIPLW